MDLVLTRFLLSSINLEVKGDLKDVLVVFINIYRQFYIQLRQLSHWLRLICYDRNDGEKI